MGFTGPNAALVGQVLDQRFRVLSLIGSGGMAHVYEVEHVTLGRRLALKVLRDTHESDPDVARRFSREAQALSRISSEHVVSIFDYGMLPGGCPFFIMELLRGDSLRRVLQTEQRLSVLRACNLIIDVCLGLHAAHRAGCVHRDLKPENLWLTRRDDGRESCVLLDFGVARFDDTHTTKDGVLVGTARYMSPEQIRADGAPGPESDIFSLGAIAYECLSGESPFATDTLERTLFRVLNEEPRSLTELATDVPPELCRALGRALNKRPSERFSSALELARAVLPFASPHRQLPLFEARAAKSSLPPEPSADTERHRATEASERDLPAANTPPTSPRSNRLYLALAFALGAALLPLLQLARSSLAPAAPADSAPPPLVATPPKPSVALTVASAMHEPAPLSSSAPARRPERAPPTPHHSATPANLPPIKPKPSGPPQPSFDGSNPYRP